MPERPVTPAELAADEVGTADQQAPQRYRVRMPAAVHLAYTLTRRDGTGRAAPALAAVLDWRTDGAHYLLQMDGVLGRLSSSGSDGDGGIEPASAIEETGERRLATNFDAGRGRVQFADGSEAGAIPGIQDRASLLMQLVGIGLARPDQMRDVLRIAVAGADSARVERFLVMGQEQVDTGLGPLNAWHLVQVVAPGESRIEVWLAPSQGWLPAMLRVTEGDGSSATQVLARTGPGTAP